MIKGLRILLFNVFIFFCAACAMPASVAHAQRETGLERNPGSVRPNIVWIVVDDMSGHFGYQGESLVSTPFVDQLAKQGTVFTNAYVTAPVCSTFRSALITGMYQTSIGAHHHRSSRGVLQNQLPDSVRTIPELFREAGYFTSNGDADGIRPGKEDYNFQYARADLYDGINWSRRDPGQPFFAQFQLRGGKHRNSESGYQKIRGQLDRLVDREAVILPPYYPDHAVLREDWAAYLDSVNFTDIEVRRIFERLRADGCLDNTVVFFLTDHGISHARGKQFLYEEGLKIPFIAWGPGILPAPSSRDQLISHIDLAATSLSLAGIDLPKGMEARPLFGDHAAERPFVVSARDRCDETVDHIRSIRQDHFKYIRNYLPQRPYLQPCVYKDKKPFMPVIRQLHAEGKLNQAQSLIMAAVRPAEELYDLNEDPWELNNLALNPRYRDRLQSFRMTLANWEQETGDCGRVAESTAAYDSDMAPYLKKARRNDPKRAAVIEQNITLMKQWAAEGR